MDDSIFSVLPKETKKIITGFLDYWSLRLMRLASTEWFNIIAIDHFAVVRPHSSMVPEIASCLQRYTKPIGLTMCLVKPPLDSHYTILATLTNLTHLEVESRGYFLKALGQFTFTEEDFVHFTALTNLQSISFHKQNITPYLHHFPNLTSLHLKMGKTQQEPKTNWGAKLPNPSIIKSLVIVDVHNTSVLDEESMGKMTNLTKLRVYGTRDFLPLKNLTNLVELSFSKAIVDYKQLTALTKLTSLEGEMFGAKEDSTFLSKLTNLEYLVIEDHKKVVTNHFWDLIHPSKLKTLHCNSKSTVDCLSHLTNLQELDFPHLEYMATANITLPNVTRLRVEDIRIAQLCPNLKALDGAVCPGEQHRSILTTLTCLKSLDLKRVDPTTFELLGLLFRLSTLSVQINGGDFEYNFTLLESLTCLKSLRLSHRNGSRKILKRVWSSIAKLTKLDHLEMSHFEESCLSILESLTKLRHLSISDPSAKKFDEAKLSNLTKLNMLFWNSDNIFSSKHPPHNCKLTNLRYLNLCRFND